MASEAGECNGQVPVKDELADLGCLGRIMLCTFTIIFFGILFELACPLQQWELKMYAIDRITSERARSSLLDHMSLLARQVLQLGSDWLSGTKVLLVELYPFFLGHGDSTLGC